MQEIDIARKIQEFLKIPSLPKKLIDDKANNIDSDKRTEDETLLAHFKEDSLTHIKTVRFIKDYYNYRAKPDLSTKNTSFLRTADLFRQQGIVNNNFILQLNNPMLIGVDPYSPDLTNEQQTWVAEECRANFWYFLREVCQLKPGMPFKANRGNISFIWNYLNHITTYMIMPRQQGKALDNRTKVRIKVDGIENALNSWKPIGKIRTGDVILDGEGNETMVIGVHPQGPKRLYNITFSDGRQSKACAEHLWTVYDKKRGTKGCWVDYPTSELLSKINKPYYKNFPIEIPLVVPIEGTKREHKISPYAMGVLYSGTQVNDGLTILTDAKNRDVFNDLELPSNLTVTNCKTFVRIESNDGSSLAIDRHVGLPVDYLEGSIEDRLALLHGFMDAKGTAIASYRLRVPEVVLSNQLRYLVRGLGGTCDVEGTDLIITLPEQFSYFKKARWERLERVENKLTVKSIEYYTDAEATCIEVDNIEQLFVTEDFVVTHNTVSVQVINFWLTYVVGRGYKSHVITLKSDNRAQFIDAIKRIRTCVPKYMMNSTYKDKDSGTYLTYKSFGEEVVNTLTISVPQQGEAAAGDLGRGLTVGTTTIDEGAYISFIEAIINGCMPSALTEMENCRVAGLPYGINYITTPNTIQHTSGAYMFDKLMKATEWREKFFDSYSESHLRYRLIKAAPKGEDERERSSAAVSMVYNYLQLGKDKDWVKETIDLLNLSLSKAKIDLLLMWTEDGEDRLFDDLTREALNNAKRQISWSKEYRDSGLFVDFFVSQDEFKEMCKSEHNDFFLIGCDTSSAVNQDACTLVLRSYKTGKVIGVGRYPLAFLDDVASIIIDLLACIPNSMLVIERNYAHHMIDNLLITLPSLGMDPFKRIFNSVYQDPVKYQKEFQEVQHTKFAYRTKEFYLRLKAHFGFNTNAKTREEFYGFINEAVAVTGYGLSYDKLVDELINLRVKGGRIDHDNNRHDDLVVSWLLTYWFIKRGNSKGHYGISTGLQLTETKNLLNNHNSNNDPANDPVVSEQLRIIRTKVSELTEELMSTTDNILALRLEGEIRRISQYLPVSERKVYTIDTIIDDAKKERNKRILRNKHRRFAA